MTVLQAQDNRASFRIEIGADTVGLDEYVEVRYSLENASFKGRFSPPKINGMEAAGGPSVSSSMTVINGKMTQSAQYTYYFHPTQEGPIEIPPVTVETSEGSLTTESMSVYVKAGYHAKGRGRQRSYQRELTPPPNKAPEKRYPGKVFRL
jgi:hypothetical protein